MNNKKIIDNLIAKSVNDKKKEFKSSRKIILSLTALTSAIVIFTTSCSCLKTDNINSNENAEKPIYEDVKVEEVIEEKEEYNYDVVMEQVHTYYENMRIRFSLAGIDMTNIKNNTILDYKKVDEITNDDLIGFYVASGFDSYETEKLVVAAGYANWHDFLAKKGCLNDKGEIDINVWVNDTFQQIYDNMTSSYTK